MRAIVAARYKGWTEGFEGHTLFLDLDVERLVTIGDGNLVDPYALCAGLAFQHPDGSRANDAEVYAAWCKVKHDRTINPRNGGSAYQRLTSIRLTDAGVNQLVQRKLGVFEPRIRTRFPGYDDACADAQLVLLSKSWAGGEFEAEWPKFTAAWNAGEWEECAVQAMPSPARMAAQNDSYHRRIASEQAHLRAVPGVTDPEEFAIWP